MNDTSSVNKSLFQGSRLALAPMAGVADYAFRSICREFGAEITYTEMVSAKALVFGDKKTNSLLKLEPHDGPAGAQIFGSDPEAMRTAAALAAEISGADFIDINMGCPVGKVVSSGDGAALMKDPVRASEIIAAVIEGSPLPVTVKLRKGWDSGHINCIELAREAERLGAAAVTLHGRTRSQMYSGRADWDIIRDTKKALGIPLIANGDIMSGADAVKVLAYTGADAVMIGRGAFGNPWLFAEAAAMLNQKEAPPIPNTEALVSVMLRHFTLMREQKGEHIACLEARKHFAWYLRGIPYAGYYKQEISQASSFDDIIKITRGVLRDLDATKRVWC